ncbi:MAG TPA: sigma-70 family RNA polymerase sigma factor [Vicinamibacterales bacterium]|nr:sigma-70 family RNA polymerase sigma factor [Vicinamibacterales bacterium]
MDATDAPDVALAQSGDEPAFQRLVERHSLAVFHLAFRLTGNESDAEDVVQETFLKVYRELKRFEARSSFRTWLHRVTVNCSYDLLRRRPRHRFEPIEADGSAGGSGAEPEADAAARPDRLAYGVEVHDRIQAAMEQLSPAERTAFVLRHFEGRSLEEIGKALGLRLGATKHSVFRAVQKMRRALAPVARTAGWES